ncbi:MAG: hypothetical protein ACPHRO_04960 [Nannocystaceae bacterium]
MNHFTKILCALVFAFTFGCSKADAPKADAAAKPADAAAPAADTKAEADKKAAPAEAKADAHAAHEGKEDPCVIGKAGGTTWCDGCKTGYIAGVKTTDKAAVDAALAAAGGAKPAADEHAHKDGPCLCPKGKAGETVWCDSCGVGYIAGEKVTDKAKVQAALAANAG